MVENYVSVVTLPATQLGNVIKKSARSNLAHFRNVVLYATLA